MNPNYPDSFNIDLRRDSKELGASFEPDIDAPTPWAALIGTAALAALLLLAVFMRINLS